MDLSLWQSWFHPQRATANSRPSAQTQTCCFSQGKKEHQNNAVRAALLGLFRIMIMQQSVNINYHGMSLVLLRWLWKVIMSRFLDMWFTVAKKRKKKTKMGPRKSHRNMKRKRCEFGYHYQSLSLIVLDSTAVRKRKIFMLEWSSVQSMNSRCSVSSWTVENGLCCRYTTFIKSMVWIEKHEGERLNNIFSPENLGQLEQYHS